MTDLDTGDLPGAARRDETGLARDAAARGSTYLIWGQNDPAKMVYSVVRSATRKARMSSAGFNEFWLLMCAGVPEWGAIGTTSIMTPWLGIDALDSADPRKVEIHPSVYPRRVRGREASGL